MVCLGVSNAQRCFQVVLQVLDCFFYKGVTVLFQIGLALIKLAEADILSADAHHDGSLVLQKMQASFMNVRICLYVSLSCANYLYYYFNNPKGK